MKTLMIINATESTASQSARSCCSAALCFEQPITALVIGKHAAQMATEIACWAGVTEVIYNSEPAYHHGIASNVSQLIYSLADGFDTLLTSAQQWGKNIMPRVAALLDVGQLSDVSKIKNKTTVERPIYAGRAIITVTSHDPVRVMTIRSTCFSSALQSQPAAPIHQNTQNVTHPRVEWIEQTENQSDFPPLSSAKVIISGGRAFKDRSQFEAVLHPLAHTLGAAVGASRAAVDAGYISNDLQIGQTGKVVAPQVYVAVGISGASQHLAGILDSKIIIAINKDPNAKIHTVASYSLIADAMQAIPELVEKINE